MHKIGDLFDITKGSVQSSKCVDGEYDFITASEEWKKHNSYSHNCEALVFAMGASGSLGRTHYANGKFVSSDLCFILTPKSEYKSQLNMKFYFYYFNTFRNKIVKKLATGTSKLAINYKGFYNYNIHLIDINKQDEMLSKIESIKNISDNVFTEISVQEKYISNLRQSILQQAIEGKLVSQDSNDEPASVLLEKIKAEKEQLIKEKKIKKQKDLPPINDEEKPFELPQGWEWCRLGELISSLKYGTSTPCNYDSSNTPVLRIPNIDTIKNKIDLSDLKYGELSTSEITDYELKNNDILLIRSNGSATLVGKVALVENIHTGICYAGYLIRLRTFGVAVNNMFLINVFISNYLRKSIELPIRTTTGVKNINSTEVSNLLIPLPPLAEQQRIVEKVDSLMALCDELEEEVKTAKKYASQLMEAVLQEAFTEDTPTLNESNSNIVEFPTKKVSERETLLAVARGNMKQETWEKIVDSVMDNEE